MAEVSVCKTRPLSSTSYNRPGSCTELYTGITLVLYYEVHNVLFVALCVRFWHSVWIPDCLEDVERQIQSSCGQVYSMRESLCYAVSFEVVFSLSDIQ